MDSTKFELSPGIRMALGDIVIAWSRVEALIAEFLSFLLQANHGAMYVLNQDIASGTQMKWIRALAEDRFTNADTKTGLNIVFDRIDLIRGERNAYVHGIWAPGADLGTARVQTVKLDRTEVIREELVTAPDLHDLFSEIESVSDELYTVLKKLEV